MTDRPMTFDHQNTHVSTAGPDSWLEKAARMGYAAKGVVYLLIGAFAAGAAFNASSHKGSESVVAWLARQSFGQIMLGAVALGLVGYAAWRVVQCVWDPEDKGTDLKGLTLRTYYFVSFLVHGALVVFAVRLITGSGASTSAGSGQPSQQTATLLSKPYGRWLVLFVALCVLGAAVYQFLRAYKASFRDRLALHRVDPSRRKWLIRLGRFGLAARGVVFGIIGFFLAVTAWQADPSETKGLEGALRTLETSTAGPWLLFVVALGLAAYGAHQFTKARYRVIG